MHFLVAPSTLDARRNPIPILPTYADYSDKELLQAMRNDDEHAYTTLFRRYLRRAYAMAYSRLRSKEITEEVVQSIFISIWDKRASLSINNMPAYLFTAIKYKALNIIESNIVFERYWDYYKRFVPQQEDATSKAVEFNELMEALEDGMEQLPEKTRKIFRLNRLEGRTVPEIAGLLHLSEKAVQYHITRSLKEIRVHLKDYLISIAFLSTFL